MTGDFTVTHPLVGCHGGMEQFATLPSVESIRARVASGGNIVQTATASAGSASPVELRQWASRVADVVRAVPAAVAAVVRTVAARVVGRAPRRVVRVAALAGRVGGSATAPGGDDGGGGSSRPARRWLNLSVRRLLAGGVVLAVALGIGFAASALAEVVA